MALALTTDVLNAIEDGTLSHAWLLELFTDEGALRCWDKPFDMTYLSNAYEGLNDSWSVEGEIRLGTDLVPEPLVFSFDASTQDDDASFVGKLVDRQWHQRKMRLSGLLLIPGTDFATPIGTHLVWNGTMDTVETTEGDVGFQRLVLNCEGGIFRALDRNLTSCTDPDQKKRDSSDRLFENVATKPRQDVPFGRAWSSIPGGGGRSGSGGSNGGKNGRGGQRF
jgi:hypothetical protein